MIYAISKLAFYFELKPNEFWSMTYKEVTTYCNCRLAYNSDRLREQIVLQDAVSNKIIQSNPLLYKRPKAESLLKVFKNLFKK